jgi:hypothetical protein
VNAESHVEGLDIHFIQESAFSWLMLMLHKLGKETTMFFYNKQESFSLTLSKGK